MILHAYVDAYVLCGYTTRSILDKYSLETYESLFDTFHKSICLKVNLILRLKFELAYFDSTVQCFNCYPCIYGLNSTVLLER